MMLNLKLNRASLIVRGIGNAFWTNRCAVNFFALLITLAVFIPMAAYAFAVGDKVKIKWGGTWYPGVVKEVTPNGKWRVSYDGWSSAYDEIVDKDRLRKISENTIPKIIPSEKSANFSVDDKEAEQKIFSWPRSSGNKQLLKHAAYYSHQTFFARNIVQIFPSVYFLSKSGRFSQSPQNGFSFSELDRRPHAFDGEGVYWLEGDKVFFRYADNSKVNNGTSFVGSHQNGRLTFIRNNAATPVKPFERGLRVAKICGGGASVGGGASSSGALKLLKSGAYTWEASFSASASGARTQTTVSRGGNDQGFYDFDNFKFTLRGGALNSTLTVAGYGRPINDGFYEYLYVNGKMLRCN